MIPDMNWEFRLDRFGAMIGKGREFAFGSDGYQEQTISEVTARLFNAWGSQFVWVPDYRNTGRDMSLGQARSHLDSICRPLGRLE